MIDSAFLQSDIFKWVILPLLIFGARIFDVAIGTLRIILISRGQRYLAPILGFFEVIVWLLAVSQIMQNLSNIACYIAYGGGFATGTLIGMFIEEKIALGTVIMRIITAKDATELVLRFRELGYGVTRVPAEGSFGRVDIVFMIVKRADLLQIENEINCLNPGAFYTVEDVRYVRQGIFPQDECFKRDSHLGLSLLRRIRKGS